LQNLLVGDFSGADASNCPSLIMGKNGNNVTPSLKSLEITSILLYQIKWTDRHLSFNPGQSNKKPPYFGVEARSGAPEITVSTTITSKGKLVTGLHSFGQTTYAISKMNINCRAFR